MKNSIRISATFSFKGETFTPTLTVDLDQVIKKDDPIQDLHDLLASNNNIDTYSYAFEVMQHAEIEYSHATGLASECLQKGQFNFQHYIQKRDEYELHEQLSVIAKETLGIENLSEKAEIKAALTQAYQLGQECN